MVRKYNSSFHTTNNSNSIKADVIILGCSLSGIVTAHKLKRKFGNSMDIVVLDLAGPYRSISKGNVAFRDEGEQENNTVNEYFEYDNTARQLLDNVARYYLAKYAGEFKIPLPDVIINPGRVKTTLCKLFQYKNGSIVPCTRNFHDYDYLNLLEKFEINQYQAILDSSMRDLFQTSRVDFAAERNLLLYYDQTTMEKHICDYLFFSTSREILRTTVQIVCGAPANSVSVLFYLHQCYRTSSSKNHLDGNNTRLREKILGYCKKHISHKLHQSIADITFQAKSIKEIRTYSDEEVILETMKGEKNYICHLLAMALKPDQLCDIRFEDQLLPERFMAITRAMTPGRAKKFVVQYEDNIWGKQGYSGDILSVRGPIIWAMERPEMSSTGSVEKYCSLMGFLMVQDDVRDSRKDVLEQLVKLFGEEAGTPVSYQELNVADVFVPRCGDYVALRRLTVIGSPKYLEWGALDIYADGDVAAALEAGHTAYLHLTSCLRPQAQTYEDVCLTEWPLFLIDNPFNKWLEGINFVRICHWTVYTAILYASVKLIGAFIKRQ